MPEDKRQNEIIRIQKKRNNFVMLDKGFLEDSRLSYKAKGILAYLLSKPDNWKVIVKDLINHSSDGKKAIYSGLRELKEHGYYKKLPVRDEKGQRISHWESVIFECPEEQPKQPASEPRDNDENPLFTQKGEVEKNGLNTASSLFTPFVHIENVQIQNGQHNNNYINNNNSNNIQSNLIQSVLTGDLEKEKTDMIGYDKIANQSVKDNEEHKNKESCQNTITNQSNKVFTKPSNIKYNISEIEKIIKENIEYDYILTDDPHCKEMLDGVLQVVVSTIVTDFKDGYISMGNENVPADAVKSVFFKLTKDEIEYFIENFNRQTDPTIKLTPYIRASLFRNHRTNDFYWKNRVNVDMPQFAEAKTRSRTNK